MVAQKKTKASKFLTVPTRPIPIDRDRSVAGLPQDFALDNLLLAFGLDVSRHLNLFTPGSLGDLLGKAGLTCESIETNDRITYFVAKVSHANARYSVNAYVSRPPLASVLYARWLTVLTLDPATDLMFWSDNLADKIERAKTDGSFRTLLLSYNNSDGIVFSAEAQRIYWADFVNPGKILRL